MVYQCTKCNCRRTEYKQVIDRNVVLLPEAVCCCLQTCKCGFVIRMVLCTSVPSLIVRNANTTKL